MKSLMEATLLTYILQQVLFTDVDIKAQTRHNTDLFFIYSWITSYRESQYNNNQKETESLQ